MIKLKDTFDSKTADGKKITLCVVRPSPMIESAADKVFNTAFREAYQNGSFLRAKVASIIEEQNVWDSSKDEKLAEIDKKINDGLLKLSKGANSGLTKLESRSLAIDIRGWRVERSELLSIRNDLDSLTCESQAENKKFDYLVSQCTVDPDDKSLYFNGVEKDRPEFGDALVALSKLLYNLDPDHFKKRPENQFLLKYQYCNDNLNLVDQNGNLCDKDFKRINDNGNYVLDDGVTLCDVNGNKIDDNNNMISDDYAPFE